MRSETGNIPYMQAYDASYTDAQPVAEVVAESSPIAVHAASAQSVVTQF